MSEQPRWIKEAIFSENRAALSAAGKKGGKKAAESKHADKIGEEIYRAELAADLEKVITEQAKLYSISPDGDVRPPEIDDSFEK